MCNAVNIFRKKIVHDMSQLNPVIRQLYYGFGKYGGIDANDTLVRLNYCCLYNSQLLIFCSLHGKCIVIMLQLQLGSKFIYFLVKVGIATYLIFIIIRGYK